MAILLAVALAVAWLERSREIVAFLAAGTSPARLMQAFLLGSVVIAGMVLGAEEYLLPAAHRQMMTLQDRQSRPTPQSALVHQGEIWYRAPDAAFVHLELVAPEAERIHGITIYRKSPAGELVEQVEAREAVWMGDRWTLLHGTISRFRANLVTHVEPFTRLNRAIGLEPDDLRAVFRPPSHMSLSELRSHLRRLRDKGIDTLVYVIDLHTKLTTPFMHVIMTMVGLAAMWGARSARRISLGFASAFCAGAGYWLLVTAGLALSRSQQLPAPLAIWLPHIVVLGLSTYIYWRKAYR
jgi:lipopolysaccharide export system permease protein